MYGSVADTLASAKGASARDDTRLYTVMLRQCATRRLKLPRGGMTASY
jgi:hypothetical protein